MQESKVLIKMIPIHVTKFNELQNESYIEYCQKCTQNGIQPEPQSRYFPIVPVKYGYVICNQFGEIHWKKRKKDFDY